MTAPTAEVELSPPDPAQNPAAAAPGPTRPAPTPTDQRKDWRLVLMAVGTVVLALWSVRWLWGGEVMPGADTTGHLQRIEHAWSLFTRGRLDGWFSGAMLGYQTHLIYGPGLAVATFVVWLASLGTVSSAGALQIVVVAALVAVPFAVARLARALGLQRWSAMVAGTFALGVSSARGGGIGGAFETALASHQLAVPLVILTMALVLECLSPDHRGRPVALVVTVAALAFSHPLSLILLALAMPMVLVAGWGAGRVSFARLPGLVAAAGWVIGLTAAWWLPAVLHLDLRGPTTGWDRPSLGDHLMMLAEGSRGLVAWIGPVAVVCVVGALVVGLRLRHRQLLTLALMPLGALVTFHLAHQITGVGDPLGMQFINRGLAYVALLATPVIARVLEAVVPHRATVAAWSGGVVVVAVSVAGLAPTTGAFQRPSPELRHAASTLAAEVRPGARFVYVGGWFGHGVPAPARWLAWASGQSGIAPFGSEYAPGAGVSSRAADLPDLTRVDDLEAWVTELRSLAVTHVVVADPEVDLLLAGTEGVGPVWTKPSLSVWRLTSAPGAPVGSVIPGDQAQVVFAEAGTYRIDITSAKARNGAELAVGWSPGWRAWIDDQPVPTHRSADGRLVIDLPAGTYQVRLEFGSLPFTHLARALSAASALVLFALCRRDQAGSSQITRLRVNPGDSSTR